MTIWVMHFIWLASVRRLPGMSPPWVSIQVNGHGSIPLVSRLRANGAAFENHSAFRAELRERLMNHA